MNRREKTKFLSELLVSQKLIGIGKYWSSEVTVDWGTKNVKRVDFMQFVPVSQMSISDIEKGEFICYEVKSCKQDFESGFGKNFIAEKNYLVMDMKTYKEVVMDIPHGVGCLVAIPCSGEKIDEFNDPTELSEEKRFKLVKMLDAFPMKRNKSTVELLFCMLRSGNYEVVE